MIEWWRSWHGAPMDNKWPVIAARSGVKVGIVSAIAWALMDYASQQSNRGDVSGFDTEVYAVYSGFDEKEIIAVIQAMTDKGIIANGHLANWEKRQPKREDDSSERVRNFRAMKRIVTQCNANGEDETSVSSSVSESESVSKENEDSVLTDPFDEIQIQLESHGILVNTASAIKAVNDILAMGATHEDIEAGISWMDQNKKRDIIYASSLPGPVRTAIQKRLQKGNGHKRTRVLTDAHGNTMEVEE